MPRKYFVEFKEKAVHHIVEMLGLESCLLHRAYEEVGELWVYPTPYVAGLVPRLPHNHMISYINTYMQKTFGLRSPHNVARN